MEPREEMKPNCARHLAPQQEEGGRSLTQKVRHATLVKTDRQFYTWGRPTLLSIFKPSYKFWLRAITPQDRSALKRSPILLLCKTGYGAILSGHLVFKTKLHWDLRTGKYLKWGT